MTKKILITLGPSSLTKDKVEKMEQQDIYLFRINLSHTPLEMIQSTIQKIRKYTNVPICLDSEGAQIRCQSMKNGLAEFVVGDVVKIHFEEVLGDSNNISFTPANIAEQFEYDDEISIDFDSACIKVFDIQDGFALAKVVSGGKIGSNKAVNLNREIHLDPITPKDRKAIEIGREMGIKHYALSFAGSKDDVESMRNLTGKDACIISKIESRKGLFNLTDILEATDEILIDRGDLSREVNIEKIPFIQRRIISTAKMKSVPVYVATNLLESMITLSGPNRAEVNDVISTLLMGADGLILAAETAVGRYPVEAVCMIRKLIQEFNKWTPNTSIEELIGS